MPTSIEFRCSQCQAPYRINKFSVGQSISCKRCPASVVVPSQSDPIAMKIFGISQQDEARENSPQASSQPVHVEQVPSTGTAEQWESQPSSVFNSPPPSRNRSSLFIPALLVTSSFSLIGVGLGYWISVQNQKKGLAKIDQSVAERKTDDGNPNRMDITERLEGQSKQKADLVNPPAKVLPKDTPTTRVPDPKPEPEAKQGSSTIPPKESNKNETPLPETPKDSGKNPESPIIKKVDPEVPDSDVKRPLLEGKKEPTALTPKLAALVDQLRNKDSKIKIAALKELAKMGATASPAAEAICDCLLHPTPNVVAASLETIEKVKPDLYKPVASLMLDKQGYLKDNAVRQLGAFGEEAAPLKNVLFALIKQKMNLAISQSVPFRLIGRHRLQWDRNEACIEYCVDAYEKICPETAKESLIPLFKDYLKSPLIITHFDSEQNFYLNYNGQIVAFGWQNSMNRLIDWAGDDPKRRKEVIPYLKEGLSLNSDQHIYFSLLAVIKFGKDAIPLMPLIKNLKTSSVEQIRDAAKQAVDLISGD